MLQKTKQLSPKRKLITLIATSSPSRKPSVAAAVFFIAIEFAQQAQASSLPTNCKQALELTGAGRSQTYQMVSRLRETLRTLHQPAGRPTLDQPTCDQRVVIARAVTEFLMRHPGAAIIRGEHRSYGDCFRRFVLGLFGPDGLASELTIPQAAEAINVPVGTLKDWLSPTSHSPTSQTQIEAQQNGLDPIVRCAQPEIAILLTEYEAWTGDLSAYCEYANTQLKLPFGRTFITHVLTAAGLYQPKQRHTPHQAPWSRGSLTTMFPGMQWFGDGKQLRVLFAGQNLLFNIEALVDGASNAVVAARVTDAEDGAAVVEAFAEGLETTGGQPPLATTLDNRPSNFTPQIDDALSCTELLRATPGRGQAKAPVEGAFGLFEQALPEAIVIQGDNVRDIARSSAQQIVHAYFRGRNGKPRAKLGGLSPALAYDNSPPTEEQVDHAKRWILELRRREQLARQNREQRADPVRLQLLREQLAQLGIDDPQCQASLSLSGYSLGAILRGLSIFQAKKLMKSLPDECDHYRYLAGIIRNTHTRETLERTAEHLLQLRLRACDLHLSPLHAKAKSLRDSQSVVSAACELVDEALDASCLLEFRFWTSQAKEVFTTMPQSQAIPLYHHLVRVIAHCFHTNAGWREQLIAQLAEAVAPIAT